MKAQRLTDTQFGNRIRDQDEAGLSMGAQPRRRAFG